MRMYLWHILHLPATLFHCSISIKSPCFPTCWGWMSSLEPLLLLTVKRTINMKLLLLHNTSYDCKDKSLWVLNHGVASTVADFLLQQEHNVLFWEMAFSPKCSPLPNAFAERQDIISLRRKCRSGVISPICIIHSERESFSCWKEVCWADLMCLSLINNWNIILVI